ncbi:MAG: hypothetical protein ABIQ88_16900 [Chitinophagaceae bacterium]
MKKLTFIPVIMALFCIGLANEAAAQTKGPMAPVKVGSVTLNIGAGIGSEYKGDYYKSPFGMKGAVEWGLWQAGPGTITLGAETGVSFSNGGGRYDDYRSRTAIIAGRSAWHYGWKVRGLDTYGGFSAGLGFHHYDYRYNANDKFDRNQVIPVIGAFVGASYFVAPRFGFNAEAGYDITNFQVGVIFKLK